MRKSLVTGVAASLLLAGALVAPTASAQTVSPTGTGANSSAETSSSADNAGEKTTGSTRDETKNVPASPSIGKRSDALEFLDADPYTDPLYIDPDKNPLKKVSSSEMFMDWTKDMPEGGGKDFVQGWAAGSTIPDTANPIELWKQEVQGLGMMSSGLFTGDFAQSSRGSSQATSVIIPVLVGSLVIGQLIELVMRGLRMAGIEVPALTF